MSGERGPEHVEAILGERDHPRREAIVRAMDLGNRLDFFFLLAYSALHASLALLVRERKLAGGAVSSLLLELSSLLEPTSMQRPLFWLRAFTILKWGSLYVSCGLLAGPLWRDRSAFRFAAIPFGLTCLLGALSLVWLPLLEVGSFVLGLGWLLALFASLQRPTPKEGAAR